MGKPPPKPHALRPVGAYGSYRQILCPPREDRQYPLSLVTFLGSGKQFPKIHFVEIPFTAVLRQSCLAILVIWLAYHRTQ